MVRNFGFITLLAFLTVMVLLPGMSGDALLQQGDEVMHITTVRYSLDSGNFLYPRLITGVTNAYKPPLLFWSSMVSESLLGRSLLGVRLPSLGAALLTVVLLYLLLIEFEISRRRAFITAAIYIFTLGTFKFARLLMMEQNMALFFLACAFFFLRYVKHQKFRDLAISGVISGIGFWFKGPLFQVYATLMLISWASIILLHWRGNTKSPSRPGGNDSEGTDKKIPSGPGISWEGKRHIAQVWRVLFYFHLFALLPVILWFVYALLSADRNTLLGFFFITENLRKFARANQNELLILLGWLLYTLPWTPIIFAGALAALKQDIRSRSALAGRILIMSTIAITLLHLLPNRKDPYYIMPLIAPLLAGVTLSFKDKKKLSSLTVVFNTVFILILSLLIFVTLFRLGADIKQYIWPLIAAIAAAGTIVFVKKEPFFYAGFFLSGIMLLLVFQFTLLPWLYRPIQPADLEIKTNNRVCVISKNPWDALAHAVIRPDLHFEFKYPETTGGCADGRQPLIVRVPEYQPSSDYEQKRVWYIWNRDATPVQILNSLRLGYPIPKLFQKVVYYVAEKE